MGDQHGADDSSSVSPTDALSHPLRRHLVEYLLHWEGKERGMVLVVNEIARFKARSGYDSSEEISLRSARIDLQEQHIPTLEGAGIVTHDTDEDMLALADSPETIHSYLEEAEE